MSVVTKSGRPRLPRVRLPLLPRLPPELERVVREQGRRRSGSRTSSSTPASPSAVPSPSGASTRTATSSSSSSGSSTTSRRLDTGFVRSWVPTAAMRNGDFTRRSPVRRHAAATSTGSPNFPRRRRPGNLIDPGGQVLLNQFPLPNADPAQTGGYNYVDNLLVDQPNQQFLARVDFNISDSTKVFVRYNLQRETQPCVDRPVVAQRRAPGPLPGGGHRPEPVGLGHGQPDPRLRPHPDQRDDLRRHLHRLPEPVRGPRTRSTAGDLGYPYQGIFGESNDQIPSLDSGGWGNNGPMYFNPGGFDPILFATKWQCAFTQNVTKVWGTHTAKAGVLLGERPQRPARQQQLERQRHQFSTARRRQLRATRSPTS